MKGLPRASVLVVDDEEGIRRSLAGLLGDEGYAAIVAEDAPRALAALEADEPDLVLLDVVLPGTDGIALLEEIRRKRRDLPVIMMSGNATVDLAVRATKLGAYDFLEKPLQPPKLLIIVERALEYARDQREIRELRQSVSGDLMVGDSRAMHDLRSAIALAAPSMGRVLVTGENGTGKELVALALHRQSARRDGPFVRMNCAAIPRDLVESELFGHERGAFTGALRTRRGRFELAHGGSLFLDEIGDMSADLQSKLLRVLEDGEVERVGGSQPIPVSVRVIAATNRDLRASMAGGAFREDLFYRLSVIPLRVPPLRERPEDIGPLAAHFLELFARENNRPLRELDPPAVERMRAHRWPGNVRELKNLMERFVIMGGEGPILPRDVDAVLGTAESGPPDGASPAPQGVAAGFAPTGGSGGPLRERVEEFETGLIRDALERAAWSVSEAARILGTDRANLHRKMRRLGIRRP